MFIVTNNRSVKKHVIGERGIFDTIKNVLQRAVSSNATKSSLALMNKIAARELDITASSAAKAAGNELVTSAISTARNIAVDKGKQFLEKTRNKISFETKRSARVVSATVSNIPSTSVVHSAPATVAKPGNQGLLSFETKPAKRTKRAKKERGISDKSKEMLTNLITMRQLQTQSNGSNVGSLLLKPTSAMRIEDLVKLGSGIRNS